MSSVKFGLSATFECGYLENQQERLLVYIDEQPLSPILYSALQAQGFRRSEDYVYRPHCKDCNACQSIRLPIHDIELSRSQKRILNKGKNFDVKLSNTVKESYYPLFEHYVNGKHESGVMYPANPAQLDSFAVCGWLEQLYIELYDNNKLIALAICDVTLDSLSAVYTLYDLTYSKYSLGTLMILQQLNIAKHLEKNWLYLGYYIKQCQKMNYKTKFSPYQILQNGKWVQYSASS